MRRSTASLLRTYLGAGPADAVLAGSIRRGDRRQIKSAILLADLRGFTALSERLDEAALFGALDRYFEAVVDGVHAEGGEVLKFLGDGVLAIFPLAAGGDRRATCRAALRAVERAGKALAGAPADALPLAFTATLHVGLVVYGNIGSPDRLDFTVLGPAVNLSAGWKASPSSSSARCCARRRSPGRSAWTVRRWGAFLTRRRRHPGGVRARGTGRRALARRCSMAERPTRYAWYDSPVGRLLLAGDPQGLTLISFPNGRPRPPPGAGVAAGRCRVFTAAFDQLAEYFAGTRTAFSLPLRPTGTAFQRASGKRCAKSRSAPRSPTASSRAGSASPRPRARSAPPMAPTRCRSSCPATG